MADKGWLRTERAALAAEQILDAAGRLFTERGVAGVGMGDVAKEAGCSRATLYRYFENRDALRTAFVHRETRRIAALVSAEIADVADPERQLVEGMTAALRLVRSDSTLAAWFTAADSGITSQLAGSSEVIEGIAAAFLGDGTDPDVRRRARWIVRVLVSLLIDPADDPDEERSLIEEFVVPVVLAADEAGR